jgi:hypothetical protein
MSHSQKALGRGNYDSYSGFVRALDVLFDWMENFYTSTNALNASNDLQMAL